MDKYACYGKLKEWLCDIEAQSEREALYKAKAEYLEVEQVILVVPGNDLGVNGP